MDGFSLQATRGVASLGRYTFARTLIGQLESMSRKRVFIASLHPFKRRKQIFNFVTQLFITACYQAAYPCNPTDDSRESISLYDHARKLSPRHPNNSVVLLICEEFD